MKYNTHLFVVHSVGKATEMLAQSQNVHTELALAGANPYTRPRSDHYLALVIAHVCYLQRKCLPQTTTKRRFSWQWLVY